MQSNASNRRVVLSRALASLALSAGLAACGGSGGDGTPPVAEPLPAAPGDWTRFDPVATEIDGKMLSPTCSGYPGTDPTFHFWARRGAAARLVVFFEGGGGCWDDATCAFPLHSAMPANAVGLYKAEILPSDDPRALSGIFDASDPRNPLRDWSYVYVPYCTGDVHGGSKTMDYVDPFTGEPYRIEHRGADNFAVVLRWIRDNFPSVEQMLVTGSSAGGYGAAIHYPALRETFPRARAAMLADAAQGVVPPGFEELRRDHWNFQLSPRVFGSDASDVPTSELTGRLASHFPGDRLGQYTTSLDLSQMLFYDAMLHGPAGQQGTACIEWSETMRRELRDRQREANNFRSYLAAGTTHTLLRDELFFTESSAGAPFSDWLAAMLSPGGEGWTNLECTDCETLAMPCPF
ncbi:MAG: hypothetical protein GX644_18390 [Limnobacter sp.]|nr:hypothetical protein [Limnobacter sp.]